MKPQRSLIALLTSLSLLAPHARTPATPHSSLSESCSFCVVVPIKAEAGTARAAQRIGRNHRHRKIFESGRGEIQYRT